jgi:hypothetical protein
VREREGCGEAEGRCGSLAGGELADGEPPPSSGFATAREAPPRSRSVSIPLPLFCADLLFVRVLRCLFFSSFFFVRFLGKRPGSLTCRCRSAGGKFDSKSCLCRSRSVLDRSVLSCVSVYI